MEKISIKKVPLKVQEMEKLRDILYRELSKSTDTQIFVERSLFDEIRYNYFDYNMAPGNEETTSHYVDYVQNIYEFLNKRGRTEGIIGFVANCKGFMQVTRFKIDRIDYSHYNCGMKKILIVCEYKEEVK